MSEFANYILSKLRDEIHEFLESKLKERKITYNKNRINTIEDGISMIISKYKSSYKVEFSYKVVTDPVKKTINIYLNNYLFHIYK